MSNETMGPDISKSALLVVDMQNDFLHPDGSFGRRAAAHPEAASTCHSSSQRSRM